MRLPTMKSLGIRAPRLNAGAIPGLRTLGPRSVSTLLKIALDVAYVLLMLITGVLLIAFVIGAFIPIDNLTVIDDTSGKEMPLTRVLIIFALGSITAYFASFLLILGHLRKIFRTLTIGDPFEPANVRRLRQIGLILAIVTGGVWLAQGMVAARLAPGVMDPQGLSELLTPIFSVLVVFVLAEVFREGARLRRESELTI
jgi:hypothetical protein